MLFYAVCIRYVEFLHKYDKKVFYHPHDEINRHSEMDHRPYIGIITEIDGVKFLAPLSSPKPWHKNIKNSCPSYIKIRGNSEEYLGIIRLCNMFPVSGNVYEEIDFSFIKEERPKYYSLLEKQFNIINSSTKIDEINKKSERIKNIANNPNHYFFKDCCNYDLLIKKMKRIHKIIS